MTFETEGFLGADAISRAAALRAKYSDLFEFSAECSAVAMMLAAVIPQQAGAHGRTTGVMFARCVSQFQGAVILAERGLSVESMTLSRAMIESTITLGALALQKVTPRQLGGSDLENRRKAANAMLPLAKRSG